MTRLPVIIGLGGVNSAGRSSSHHGYRRLVIDALDASAAQQTHQSLAQMMGVNFDPNDVATLNNGTLIRKIENNADLLNFNQHLNIQPGVSNFNFICKARDLPTNIPPAWEVTPVGDKDVRVTAIEQFGIFIPDKKVSKVQSAGQLPSGFDPATLYASRNHPRGLQMTVYGASDAIQSMGIPWSTIEAAVRPDHIAVYASAAMSQLDEAGFGGMMKSASLGQRTSSKQCALGFAEMPADFINAYMLNSVGSTGGVVGACATYLYNLRLGIQDIQSGRRRVVIVGTSEAPILPEVMEGYRAMGALAEDDQLRKLDQLPHTRDPDHRRACRPFANNCGFTIAESSQYIVLCDDALALELGAQIHAAVPDVFVHADGNKKSISAPGVGNFITMAKAARLGMDILGEESLQRRSYVHAHGTGTPRNRATESEVLNNVAKAFGISNWPVAAIKCYVGHSIGSAAGDQLAAALGTWQHGIIPGINTLDAIASDVHQSNLSIKREHSIIGAAGIDMSLINSKGFGGNNATALLLGPHIAQKWLQKKYGDKELKQYTEKLEVTLATAKDYDDAVIQGKTKPLYNFGSNVHSADDVDIDRDSISIAGIKNKIPLSSECAESYDLKDLD